MAYFLNRILSRINLLHLVNILQDIELCQANKLCYSGMLQQEDIRNCPYLPNAEHSCAYSEKEIREFEGECER